MKNEIINFLLHRRSVSVKSMVDVNISDKDLDDILAAGIRVPDHGALNPWKIIILRGEARHKFGREVVVKSFLKNNPKAEEDLINIEKNRFSRAPIVICVLSSPVESKKIPEWEMHLSSSIVCYNILIAAQSLGYAAQWLTGWCAYDDNILKALGGNINKDKIAGFINIGGKEKEPLERIRPAKDNVITEWK